jgi:hypothetical protein
MIVVVIKPSHPYPSEDAVIGSTVQAWMRQDAGTTPSYRSPPLSAEALTRETLATYIERSRGG